MTWQATCVCGRHTSYLQPYWKLCYSCLNRALEQEQFEWYAAVLGVDLHGEQMMFQRIEQEAESWRKAYERRTKDMETVA